MGQGSPGGKAQGLINIQQVLNKAFPRGHFQGIEISIPTFVVIRSGVFRLFMERNKLYHIARSGITDERIAHAFQQADLPFEILGDLQALTSEVRRPLAVRSSSRLEDALYEPFAGIYATKMTPNNQFDADTRFRKLVEAIKYIYASTFFRAARDYMAATSHSIEEEEMAVMIQEVVGSRHGDRFYPELSGVARSVNYYPMGRCKPEDGVVNLALGLGKTIVDGGVSWTYSPARPRVSAPFASVGEMLKKTQNEFWAVNMGKPPAYDPLIEDEYLLIENLTSADRDGTLKHIASTLDQRSGRVSIGVGVDGPRILTFAPLLNLNDIPLNDCIKELLAVCKAHLKAPVEIEFAMTFPDDGPAQFSFLQVRPMVEAGADVLVDKADLRTGNLLLASESVLGNHHSERVQHVLFVKPQTFESRHTKLIAAEVAGINKKMLQSSIPYLLIGFGRWGSSDPWLGIPVNWGQIAGATAIVEAMRENMNVELSQGSHFFHNLTSFNVPYLSIPYHSPYQVNWDWLARQKTVTETDFVQLVETTTPLQIRVDGKHGRGIVCFQ